jgi:wyosine [tRNA(Phe)-imidazoG37] synthetase (radical SAM superfamily)
VVDHVTVSGSGEPTLYPEIGALIAGIKAMTNIPLAVITNGTLLSSREVREALCQADVVLPSLDAAENRIFNRIARPPGGLKVEDVIAGLVAFRRQFNGQLWLEVLLIRGLNDTSGQVYNLKVAIDTIKPDRIHLNTVVRPPATDGAFPVPSDRMEDIASYFGPRCEVMTDEDITSYFGPRCKVKTRGLREELGTVSEDMAERIIQAVKRRPMTMRDLAESQGTIPAMVLPLIARLRLAGVIQERNFNGRLYYLSNNEGDREVGCNREYGIDFNSSA